MSHAKFKYNLGSEIKISGLNYTVLGRYYNVDSKEYVYYLINRETQIKVHIPTKQINLRSC